MPSLFSRYIRCFSRLKVWPYVIGYHLFKHSDLFALMMNKVDALLRTPFSQLPLEQKLAIKRLGPYQPKTVRWYNSMTDESVAVHSAQKLGSKNTNGCRTTTTKMHIFAFIAAFLLPPVTHVCVNMVSETLSIFPNVPGNINLV